MKLQIPFNGRTLDLLRACLVFVALLGVSGCVSKNARQGVENRWRDENAPVFKQGVTTEHDVLAALGPPSQLINLGNQTVFYYLQEQKQTRGLILILYNQTVEKITYYRAIFFFDQQGRLTDFAKSDEKIPAK
jgi:outer membrane protein assembly factor BamE (lipoprotein component of BamABCDE complex)